MRISKNQLKQIIKEELEIVLGEAFDPLAGPTVVPAPVRTHIPPGAKKGAIRGVGKALGRVAAGPVGMAVTGAEIAGHAIDMGVGGSAAKVGKAQYSLGGSEQAAYDEWAKNHLATTGQGAPSYGQYLDIKSGAKTPEQVKIEMEQQ